MLWLKAFHVIAVVTWFACLFYLPRLYVYHADADDSITSSAQNHGAPPVRHHDHWRSGKRGIGRRDWWRQRPPYLTMGWLRIKLLLVLLLIAYHVSLLQADARFCGESQ